MNTGVTSALQSFWIDNHI